MAEKIMNLFEKLAKITEEIAVVGKNLTVDTGNGKGYKAVSERDILDAVKPIEAKYKVYSYPFSREILEKERLETETKYGVKTSFYSTVKTVYRFVNAENPAEYIDITSFSEGIDSGDKGFGKAMTYGDKYALMKAYKISTGDDPDAEASPEEHYKGKGQTKKSKETGEVASDSEKNIFIDVCSSLNVNPTEILKSVGWNGGPATKENIIAATEKLQQISNAKA